jgi:hypothetical protein
MKKAITAWRIAGLAAALALLGIALSAPGAPGISAQDGGAIMKVNPPAIEVKKGDERVPVVITVENVKNMASFQFILQYDADVFQTADPADGDFIQKGDFLGTTGREVVCNTVSESQGAVRYTCVTLRETPPGPDGSGTVATVYLTAVGAGPTDLTLDRVKANVVSSDAEPLPIGVQNASVRVKNVGGGFNWLLWVPLVLVAVLVAGGVAAFARMRAHSSSGKPAAVA